MKGTLTFYHHTLSSLEEVKQGLDLSIHTFHVERDNGEHRSILITVELEFDASNPEWTIEEYCVNTGFDVTIYKAKLEDGFEFNENTFDQEAA